VDHCDAAQRLLKYAWNISTPVAGARAITQPEIQSARDEKVVDFHSKPVRYKI
jgi:hypothetical protein